MKLKDLRDDIDWLWLWTREREREREKKEQVICAALRLLRPARQRPSVVRVRIPIERQPEWKSVFTTRYGTLAVDYGTSPFTVWPARWLDCLEYCCARFYCYLCYLDIIRICRSQAPGYAIRDYSNHVLIIDYWLIYRLTEFISELLIALARKAGLTVTDAHVTALTEAGQPRLEC